MEEKLIRGKMAVTALLSGVAAVLGWKGILFLAWVAVMLLDYLSGSAAAAKSGEWNSAKAREGLWHKGGMIVCICVAGIADLIFSVVCDNIPIGIKWPVIVLPLVVSWYILTELGSILENAVKMGARVPDWLVKILKISLQAIDTAGDKTIEDSGAKEQ